MLGTLNKVIKIKVKTWHIVFTYPHVAIESDPTVLKQLEALIRSKLPEAGYKR